MKVVHKNKKKISSEGSNEPKTLPKFIVDIFHFMKDMTGTFVFGWSDVKWDFLQAQLHAHGWHFGYCDENKRFELMPLYKIKN